jgi:hypothetical protein
MTAGTSHLSAAWRATSNSEIALLLEYLKGREVSRQEACVMLGMALTHLLRPGEEARSFFEILVPAVQRRHDQSGGVTIGLSNDEVEELLVAALAINDKLKIGDDHVEFEGSMQDAEIFREAVNRIWHRWEGWT